MVFRNLFRNFTNRSLTSNLEVLKDIQIPQSALSSKTDIVKNNQKITRLNEFFHSNPDLKYLKDIPSSYFFKNPAGRNKSKIFLVDKDAARNIFKALHPHLKTNKGHVVEVNAGVGVLTEELLKAKLQKVRVHEPDPMLCNLLLKLIRDHKSDARLFMVNFLNLGHILSIDMKTNNGMAESLFDGLPTLNWDEEAAVKVIGAMRDVQFIRHIMFSVALQSGICKYGRPELFLLLPPEEYKKLKATPNEERKIYKSNSVLFQILFDHEELLRVPEKGFIPWRIEPHPKKRKSQIERSEDLCLVKITPKTDLLQTIPPGLLKPLWFFVKIMMQKKSSSLIERIEKWIPGSGVHLITKGYTIFTECGSLTPQEYLKIYLEFTSLPDFYSCSFLPYVEDILGKVLLDGLSGLSDEKFNKLFSKESGGEDEDDNDDDDDVDVFDDSATAGSRDQNVIIDERDR